ncbi:MULTISPECIES: hypothetical protein [Pseudomonas]|uniref:Uncharacterized protein n=2 Tax=Pseudomonas TaxID=286 RepID=A0ACC5MH61_9PSED|nr:MULTISPECIES: hypothetical protein [Pseudomonas]ATE79887.1 hypothetical protein CNN82_27075 [Pseudomonas frederiksbergensis]MBB2888004.1 hypothetical protein [Pseudomonas umsongensis]NMN79450.1 hypothetical protein [Pseudomonas sp. KD5]CAH0308836.1 hypothetical protein SRABI123_04854 [Pseudomonas sp. Bi123]
MEFELKGNAQAIALQTGASVLHNSLLGFGAKLSSQDKQFVKNSIRYAKNRANKKYNSVKQAADWFEYYSGVLWSVGWGLDQPLVEVVDRKFSGSVTAAYLDVMSRKVGRNKAETLVNALNMLGNDDVLQGSFAARVRESGELEILPAELNPDGTLGIFLSHVRLLKLDWSTGFWGVGHSMAQLDIRVREFTIRQRGIEKNRQILQGALDELEEQDFIDLMSHN